MIASCGTCGKVEATGTDLSPNVCTSCGAVHTIDMSFDADDGSLLISCRCGWQVTFAHSRIQVTRETMVHLERCGFVSVPALVARPPGCAP